jgi:hypothetical protein
MKKAIDTWSDYDKRTRDLLDRSVAEILEIDEQGNVITPDNLTDKQTRILDRWHAQIHDPAYMATEWVRARRKARYEQKWYHLTTSTKFVIGACIWSLTTFLSLKNVRHDLLFIGFSFIFMMGLAYIEILERLEKTEESQIFREWNIHLKLNRILEELFAINQRAK